MPDGSKWDVPIMVIAQNRAKNYADEFDNDVERSLREDTELLFEESPYEVHDWVGNQMDWEDVEHHIVKAVDAPPVNLRDGWYNGEKKIV